MERVQIGIWSVSGGGGCTGCFEPVEILPASHVNSLIDPPPSPFVAFQFLIRAGSFLRRCVFERIVFKHFSSRRNRSEELNRLFAGSILKAAHIDRFERVLRELKESR